MEETQKESEKNIIDKILGAKKECEQATSEIRKEIAEIFSAYSAKMDEVSDVANAYRSKESVPKLRTEVSYIKPFIFSGDPEIEVKGVGAEDEALSKILEKIVNWRVKNIKNYYSKIEDWVHQGVTFGTSIMKVVWRFQTQKNPDGTETPVLDEPNLEVPNILDVYRNPIIPEIEEQPYMIFRSVHTPEDIRTNPAYDYTGELGLNRERVIGGAIRTEDGDSTRLNKTDIPSAEEATKDMVEVLEYVTKEKIQTIAIGKEQVVLRDTVNPYGFIAAVKFVFETNTIPNRFDGLGVGHNTIGLGKMYYQLWNQTLDNVKLTNNPMFLFAKGHGIDKKQLVAKPGGGVSVDTGNQPINNVIQPVLFPDIKSGVIEILSRLDDEHKRASGANDLLQGSASNKTLGQDELAQQNTSNRFELVQRRFKHALSKIAEMILKMELQNLQSIDSPILRIFPEEFRMTVFQLLKQDAMNIKYNIDVKGETIIARNKARESQRLVELFSLAQNFLTDTEKRSFLRRIAERQGEQDIDSIIAAENPLAIQQEQMMAMPQQTYEQGEVPQTA